MATKLCGRDARSLIVQDLHSNAVLALAQHGFGSLECAQQFCNSGRYSGNAVTATFERVSVIALPSPAQAECDLELLHDIAALAFDAHSVDRLNGHPRQPAEPALATDTGPAAEHSLQHDMRLLERALQAAPTGIVISDARENDCPIIYVNPAFERLTGYRADEVIGRNCRFLQGDDRDQPGLAKLRAGLRYGEGVNVLLRNYRKDGTPFWNDLIVSPLRSESGELTHFIGVQTDVTDRKLMVDALTESQERYRALVTASAQIVWSADPAGRADVISPTWLAFTGQSIAEYIGDGWIAAVHPDDRERARLAWRASVEAGSMFHCEYRMQHVAGAYRSVSSRGVPLRDLHGNIREWIGMTTDNTEQKQLQAQVIRADKLAALGEIAAGVAHEINNPIAAISGVAQLLEARTEEDVAADARSIRQMAERASKIVASLLTFSRSTDSSRVPADLNQAVHTALEMTRFRLRQYNVDVTTDLAVDLPKAMFNVNEIEQVVVNLITNAEYAMRGKPRSQRNLHIATFMDATKLSASVVVQVADTGGGIPDHIISRIFDPFFTTKDIDEGTGLGLSICHGILEAHGGSLEVESNIGRGATFVVRIPVDSPVKKRFASSDDAG